MVRRTSESNTAARDALTQRRLPPAAGAQPSSWRAAERLFRELPHRRVRVVQHRLHDLEGGALLAHD
eukprot:6725667-Prymnesium_polylepis.1